MTPATMSDDKPFSTRGCANGFGGSQDARRLANASLTTGTAKTATPSPQSVYATPKKESPLLFEGMTWREFKAVEQLLDRSGYRLSFLNGILEI
ncbi:MAG: hypothetical protein V7L29_17545 [Nostoc sp.]|uniref:hypothetical protein n=1 Tax=Nostoc sp. TaxID=1180 RepID=UPI002FF0E874